jgi:WD40 repeat protein
MQGHNSYVFSMAFGAAHQLATGGADATLRLWDTSTGNATAAPEPVSTAVRGVAISPDGRLAAEATNDGIMRLSPAIADPSQLCAKLTINMSHKQWREWVSRPSTTSPCARVFPSRTTDHTSHGGEPRTT